MIASHVVAWVALALNVGTVQRPPAAKVDDNLAAAIRAIDGGDPQGAIGILVPLIVKMKKSNPRPSEVARAYLYLGVAFLDLDPPLRDQARANFREASRRDPRLKLLDTDFSLAVREAFEEAKTAASPPQEQVAAIAPTAGPSPTIVSPDTWISPTTDANVLELRLAHADREGSDEGILRIDKRQQRVRWIGPPGCSLTLEGGFDIVKGVTLSAGVGFLVERVGARETFVPAHHAALLGKGQSVRRVDLAAHIAQEINAAVNMIQAAIGWQSSPSSAAADARSGPVIDTTIPDVLAIPSDFETKNVRLRGRFDVISKRGNEYMLSQQSFVVAIVPDPSQTNLIRDHADRLAGKDIEVSGLFLRRTVAPTEATKTPAPFMVRFHSFVAPEGFTPRAKVDAMAVSLAELMENRDQYEGKMIRTVGCFRGANKRSDLLRSSSRHPTDWIIKHGEHAVWIMGRQPTGDDFALDITSYADISAGQWLSVAGKVDLDKDNIYLKASEVAMSPPPSDNPTVKEPLQQGPVANLPPKVKFWLPWPEAKGAQPDTKVVVVFSTDMNEDTFPGRVQLRYVDAQGPIPLPLAAVRYSARAITVVPGTVLQPGKELECVLLNGIKDTAGRALAPRAGTTLPEGVAWILRYRVRSE